MIDMSRSHYMVFYYDSVILESDYLKTRVVAEAINCEPKEKLELLKTSNYMELLEQGEA